MSTTDPLKLGYTDNPTKKKPPQNVKLQATRMYMVS